MEAERLQRALQLFNIITTVISVIPLLGAIYALITGQAHVALQLDILGIILTIVTKGGLFLLTMALLPALKAIPAGFGTGFGAWLFNRFMKARESKKRPATQPRDPVAP